MLPGARTVVSFFLPFAAWVVEANAPAPHQGPLRISKGRYTPPPDIPSPSTAQLEKRLGGP